MSSKGKKTPAKPAKYYTKPERDAHQAKLYKAMLAQMNTKPVKTKPSKTPNLKNYYPPPPPGGSYGPGSILPWEPLRPNRQGGGNLSSHRAARNMQTPKPGFATSLQVSKRRSSKSSSNNQLDASAGAAATVTAVVAPWTAFRNNMKPGVADGSVNNSIRYWSSNTGTITSKTSATDLSECIRLSFYPNLVGHMYEWTTWTNKIPAASTMTNATEYAAIAGEGILFYRVVAMGVQVKNITDEAQLEGATTLTQLTNAFPHGVAQSALDDYIPNYIGASNKPGVIMQSFWLPEADNNPYTAIAGGVPAAATRSMGSLDFATTTSPGIAQVWFYQTFMLVECLGTGDGLHTVSPYIGDPTTYAEGLGNSLSKAPQFSMERCFKSDDVVETSIGSGIEMLENTVPGASFVKKAIEDVFHVDVAKEASKWARSGIKELASRAGNWFSGLWGQTGITPTEFKLAGMIVSMKEQEVDTLQQLSAAHPGPGELRAWAETVLGVDVTWSKGRFVSSPLLRGEIQDPGPMPIYIPRDPKYIQQEEKLILRGNDDDLAADNIAMETTLSRRHEPASPALSYISVRSVRTQPLSKK